MWVTPPTYNTYEDGIIGKEGVVFKADNIIEEALIEKLMEAVGKYTAAELMNKLE